MGGDAGGPLSTGCRCLVGRNRGFPGRLEGEERFHVLDPEACLSLEEVGTVSDEFFVMYGFWVSIL